MRFLLDEDLNPLMAEVGRGLGLEVVSVHEIRRRGFSDRDQLEFAVAEERILVTRNRDDFIRLVVELYQAARTGVGVLIVPHSLPNHQAERVAHALMRWAERWNVAQGAVFEGVDFLAS
jgi:predicted nuclease of predicted toxin-antitoxin system